MNYVSCVFAILFMASSVGAAEDTMLYSALPKDGCAAGRKRCEGICNRCIAEGRKPDGCYGGVIFNICCDGNGGYTDGSSCECRAK